MFFFAFFYPPKTGERERVIKVEFPFCLRIVGEPGCVVIDGLFSVTLTAYHCCTVLWVGSWRTGSGLLFYQDRPTGRSPSGEFARKVLSSL